jgi:hypothetical protein
MTNTDMQMEALSNARNGASMTNYPAIFAGFQAKGIAAADIKPRENVFTFKAWQALGRVVKKGEHGVKVITFIPTKDKDTGDVIGRRPWQSTVFHITQTKELGAANSEDNSARREWNNAKPVAKPRADYVRDPGEDAADRWSEQFGD